MASLVPQDGRHREPRSGQRARCRPVESAGWSVGPGPRRPARSPSPAPGGGHRRGRHRRGRPRWLALSGPPAAVGRRRRRPYARAVSSSCSGPVCGRSSPPQRSRSHSCWLVLVTDVVFGATQVLLLVAATDVLGMGPPGGFGALSAALGAGFVAALLVVNRAARSSRALVVLGVAVLGDQLAAAGRRRRRSADGAGPGRHLGVGHGRHRRSRPHDAPGALETQLDHLARVLGILDPPLVGANVLGAAVTAWMVGVVGIRLDARGDRRRSRRSPW